MNEEKNAMTKIAMFIIYQGWEFDLSIFALSLFALSLFSILKKDWHVRIAIVNLLRKIDRDRILFVDFWKIDLERFDPVDF